MRPSPPPRQPACSLYSFPAADHATFAVSHRYQAHDTTPGWVEAQLAEKPVCLSRQQRQKGAIELGVDDPALGVTMRKIDHVIRDMEAALADSEWLAGDGFTLAESR